MEPQPCFVSTTRCAAVRWAREIAPSLGPVTPHRILTIAASRLRYMSLLWREEDKRLLGAATWMEGKAAGNAQPCPGAGLTPCAGCPSGN